MADGSIVDTALSAYVGKHEVLTPLSLVTDWLKPDFAVEADKSGLYFTIPSPSFSMETQRLTEFVRDGVDFRLNAVSVNGAPHINLKGLEKLLNIAFEKTCRQSGPCDSQTA